MPALLQRGLPVGPELFILILFPAMLAIVAVVVSALIYRDAKRRNSSHTPAWTICAFFGGVIVWILYFVVRDEVGPSGSAAQSGV